MSFLTLWHFLGWSPQSLLQDLLRNFLSNAFPLGDMILIPVFIFLKRHSVFPWVGSRIFDLYQIISFLYSDWNGLYQISTENLSNSISLLLAVWQELLYTKTPCPPVDWVFRKTPSPWTCHGLCCTGTRGAIWLMTRSHTQADGQGRGETGYQPPQNNVVWVYLKSMGWSFP